MLICSCNVLRSGLQRLAEMKLYLQRQPTDTSAAIAKLDELEESVDTLVNQKQAKITGSVWFVSRYFSRIYNDLL